MTTHRAQCACGQLTAEAEGEPDAVVACSCLACQRRSGSPLGVAAYFDAAKVRITGESKAFMRVADSGRTLTNFFCPTCGSTVHFRPDNKPGQIGIPVGAFADPAFPPPHRTVWDQSRHPWLRLELDVPHFARGRS